MSITQANEPLPNVKTLATLLATGLLRWHQQRLICSISDISSTRRLAISSETVLTVVTPENGSGDSETLED